MNAPLQRVASALASLALAAGAARAQEFPSRPVELMVAFPAGGSTDIGARVLAAIAEKQLGQPIVVVNEAGAGGQIGFTEVARAKPDGYTLGFLNLPAVNTIILDPERKAAFNVDSFIPVINQVLIPALIWVKATAPTRRWPTSSTHRKRTPARSAPVPPAS